MNFDRRFFFSAAAMAVLWSCAASTGFCGSVLVAQGSGDLGYGYGFSSWNNFTAALDTATGNQVTVVPNFNNLAQMLTYDAIMLDQRWTAGVLGATEAANIGTFMATGRRVLMIGENDSWTAWNNQILNIVGGTYAGESSQIANRLVINDITNGAPTLTLPAAGTAGAAGGGTALYNPNFATLWGAGLNVLTVLDVNVWDDDQWNVGNSGIFGTNVAVWLASGPRVPEPGSFVLAAVGFVAAVAIPRGRR